MFFFFLLLFYLGLCRTESGTFKDGDLLVNKDGVRVVSENEVETVCILLLPIYFMDYFTSAAQRVLEFTDYS